MITAGIDCGTGNTKATILKDGEITGKAKVLTGFDRDKAVEDSLDKALKAAGVGREDLHRIGWTGSGINDVKMADLEVNEVKAMGKGANFCFPGARTVVDVGAEEGRAARIDAQGNTQDFAVNEKCAAGAGVFIETMSRALEIPLEEMGPLALTSEKSIPMNAQCVVFAESEVVGLIHSGTEKKDISRAIHEAMAGRIVSTIRRIGVNEDVVMIGGVAYNPGFVEAVRRELKLRDIHVPEDPEYTASVGAAVVAAEEA
ncbi:MAG: acyl-CoA dehydratase activase [Thermodesulfobacteriota bacterium]